MTPETVLNSVRTTFDEGSTLWVDNDEIYTYMWEAEQELNNLTECYRVTNTSIVTDGTTQEYTLSAGIDIIYRLTWNSVKLKRIGLTDQDALDLPTYGGTPSTGNPTSYYIFGDTLGLYPIPQTSQTVKIYHLGVPATLSSGSTTFSIPVIFHNFIRDYTLYNMYLKDADDGRAGVYLQKWERGLAKAKQLWARRQYSDKYSVVREVENYPQTNLGII
jgi:hypothetical protein